MQSKEHSNTERIWSPIPVFKGKTMVDDVKFNHAHRQTIDVLLKYIYKISFIFMVAFIFQ